MLFDNRSSLRRRPRCEIRRRGAASSEEAGSPLQQIEYLPDGRSKCVAFICHLIVDFGLQSRNYLSVEQLLA
ncbi:hypothetical protein [Labrys wisconsinensis]|uniref:Uncharacterized protein n=1 Tax=Labrys wisconsinensis TaxID=425677 RepID=A0ABU0JPZ2_9HYPH|nr:hypothetical protein [Labrys wisconsinensis]MDQ0475217.1 hypothetical protein [Labrys wisconsinensis]